MASTSKDTSRIIIHHLANIHFSADPRVGGNGALQTYTQMILAQDANLPDIMVITGNLTLAGTVDELRQVAEALSPLATKMNQAQRRGIVLVPGSHDLFWLDPSVWAKRNGRKDKDHPKRYYDAIGQSYQALHQFFPSGLYTVPGRAPNYMHGQFLIYTLDTCFQPVQGVPEKDPTEAEKVFGDYAEYHERERNNPAKLLQQMIAAAPRDRGQLQENDLNLFTSVRGSDTDERQLRILATHHPLFATSTLGDAYQVPERVDKALEIAQSTSFQLLLHGHTHRANALMTTYPAQVGQVPASILQVGGGSFVATPYNPVPTYNQLTAQHNVMRPVAKDHDATFWSVKLETHTLTAPAQAHYYPSFVLGGASDLLSAKVNQAKEADEATARRKTLERRVNLVLRDLAHMLDEDTRNDVASALDERRRQIALRRTEDDARASAGESDDDPRRFEAGRRAADAFRVSNPPRGQSVNPVAEQLSKIFRTVYEMFTLDIFKGIRINVVLALKPRIVPSATLIEGVTPRMSLDGAPLLAAPQGTITMPYAHLLPNSDMGPVFRDGLPYISTLAGWSVILGDIHTLAPAPASASATEATDLMSDVDQGVSGEIPHRRFIDIDWLIKSQKLARVIDELRVYEAGLMRDAAQNPTPDLDEETKRVNQLIQDLDARHANIEIERLFMKRTIPRNGPYVPYVSVSVPLRENGHDPHLEEMGVIQVDVGEDDAGKAGILRPYQREMLRTVSHLIWLILTTTRVVEDYQNIGKGHNLAYQQLDAEKRAVEHHLSEAYRTISEQNKRIYGGNR